MRRHVVCFLSALMALALAFGAFSAAFAEDPAPTAGTIPGSGAAPETEAVPFTPDFTFTTTDREGIEYTEQVFSQHTLTMVNFWEPWCGPCVREMPELQQLSEVYAENGFAILGVYSYEDGVQEVIDWSGVTYPLLNYVPAFDALQTGYVPTTVFVDSAGKIVYGPVAGSNSLEGWGAIVAELLGVDPVAAPAA